MNYQMIDENLEPLFQKLAEVGITLDEEKLRGLILTSKRNLAEQKQAINREVGFMVNLHSDVDWYKAIHKSGGWQPSMIDGDQLQLENAPIFGRLMEAKILSSLIQKLQHIHGLANGNHQVTGRPFGIYPKYGLDASGGITTISEMSLGDIPEEALETINRAGIVFIKAVYSSIILSVVQKLSGDPYLGEDLGSEDFYMACARRLFGQDIDITPFDKDVAAAVVNVCGVGGGPDQILNCIGEQENICLENAEVMQIRWRYAYIKASAFLMSLETSQGRISSFFGRSAKILDLQPLHSCLNGSTPSDRVAIRFPIAATAVDLAKLGFIGLFEDYRLEGLGSGIFAITPYSAFLFAPSEHTDLVSSVVRECLENAHTDFALRVDITVGNSLHGLV